ncbi:MAG: UvrD-helicase domain-containing protein [Petrimonas mucosa]|jgi:ATP-dependent helicase/nuclease subunit A
MQSRASSDFNHLLLIKASAGSGKTHRLTGEYLRLLFSAENQYRHILAVTFTNKATDEMKSRVVKELYKLSTGEESGYVKELTETFQIPESRIREKAKSILESILHDYSAFYISTIDKFFQQTLRAFTREMGLSGGFKLELDNNFVLTQVIDLMIFELDKPQNSELAGWILDYMKTQIEEGKSWNIRQNIGKLGNQLFNEKYKLLTGDDKQKIGDKKELNDYRQELLKIIRSWEGELKSTGTRAHDLMNRFGLSYTDFKHGKNSGFLTFVKLANGDFKEPSDRFKNRADNLEEWIPNKSDKREAITSAYYEGLNDCVKQVVHLFENNLHYNTAVSILQNYHTLGILTDIRQRLQEYQQENNTLFLSDTTELLNKIVSDSESPFVYEKTGTRIDHYMIDEFQDTSSMQWQNFRPLIKESLDSGHFNLIVGDVKQSIYRWRNSDWELLESRILQDFQNNTIRNSILDTNWRSDSNIVHFNNALFATAANKLQEKFNSSEELQTNPNRKITEAYQHVRQAVPPGRDREDGYVKITFLDASDKENDWKSKALEQLPLEIERLQDQGFSLKEIAILVRKNDEAVEVAETLLHYKEQNPQSPYRYDIISNDALVIGNAQSVKAVIAMLRHFQNRNDETRRMLAVYEFYRFHRKLQPDRAIGTYFDEEQDFPVEIKTELYRISTLPFYEMIEAFFAMSSDALDEKENAYVQAFLDIVLKFSADASSDINDFLEWWDEKGCGKTLFSPDDQDAIRLITIHKSKGLGFGAVIMPFLKWEIDHTGNMGPILWCKPKVEPFNMLGTIPLQYKSSLENTLFKEEYLQEKLYTYIDNLNLLYVAFTRAKNRIVAYAPKPAADKVTDISSLLWCSLSAEGSAEGQLLLRDYLTEEDNRAIFEMGRPVKLRHKPEGESEAPSTLGSGKWQSVPFNKRLKLRLNSAGFFSEDGSRAYGTLMHEIISSIHTLDDLKGAIEARYISGEINSDERREITGLLTSALSQPEVSGWYSGKYHVINETEVLHPVFGFSRPDRIMIGDKETIVVDYKFGEREEEKYKRQVKHYLRLIREMGYDNVKGFIFYVKLGKVVEVNKI